MNRGVWYYSPDGRDGIQWVKGNGPQLDFEPGQLRAAVTLYNWDQSSIRDWYFWHHEQEAGPCDSLRAAQAIVESKHRAAAEKSK